MVVINLETGMPSFNTLSHNSHVIFSRCWNTCSLHNKIIGHLAAFNCNFYLFYLCGLCALCVFLCVYYVYYVYLGQVPEINLMYVCMYYYLLVMSVIVVIC